MKIVFFIRKLFIVVFGAWFLGTLGSYLFLDVELSYPAAITALVLVSWMLIRDFCMTLYVEHNIKNGKINLNDFF